MKKTVNISYKNNYIMIFFFSIILFSIFFLAIFSKAELGQYIETKTLIQRANIICVGIVENLRIEKIKNNTSINNYLAYTYRIDKTIKGNFKPNTIITVLMGKTTETAISQEIKSLLTKRRFILFLKPYDIQHHLYKLMYSEGMLEVAPTTPPHNTNQTDINYLIEEEILWAIKYNNIQIASNALHFLGKWNRNNKTITQVLNWCITAGKPTLREQALVLMIKIGNYKALHVIRNTYIKQESTKNELRNTIAEIREYNKIPELIEISHSDAPTCIRLGAIEALQAMSMSIHNKKIKTEMKHTFEDALNDSNTDIQYHALMGLGNIKYGITNKQSYIITATDTKIRTMPTYEDFQNNPGKYIEIWRPSPKK